jgi:rubrerythrin
MLSVEQPVRHEDGSITFYGRRYVVVGAYFRSGHRFLHRDIWTAAYGLISGGHDIHHKDHDALNNVLDNLELMLATKHRAMHAKERAADRVAAGDIGPHHAQRWQRTEAGQERMKTFADHLNVDRTKADANRARWQYSGEGQARLRELVKSLHTPRQITCRCCGTMFMGRTRGRYCSIKCRRDTARHLRRRSASSC